MVRIVGTCIMKIMIGIIDMLKWDMVTMTIIGMIHRMIEWITYLIHNQYTLPLDDRLTQLVIKYGLLNDSVWRHLSSGEQISLLSVRKVSKENLLIIKYKSHLKP